jgi:membrane-associated phospholipid phosphatase
VRHFFLLFFILLKISVLAQKDYRLTWPREAALVGTGGLTLGFTQWGKFGDAARTPSEVAALDARHIHRLDRWAVHQNSRSARRASDVLLYTSPIWPSLLLLDPAVRRQAPEAAVMVGEVGLLTVGLTLLTKAVTHRDRPYAYNPAVPMRLRTGRDARHSFFSGHTSTLAACGVVSAKIWSDAHPDSRWRPAVWAGAVALPITMGWLRVRGGRHFPTDVLAGLLVGGTAGWLVPHLHQVR